MIFGPADIVLHIFVNYLAPTRARYDPHGVEVCKLQITGSSSVSFAWNGKPGHFAVQDYFYGANGVKKDVHTGAEGMDDPKSIKQITAKQSKQTQQSRTKRNKTNQNTQTRPHTQTQTHFHKHTFHKHAHTHTSSA